MKKSLLVLLVLSPLFSFAQFVQIFDIDDSDFPLIKAKYIAVDSESKQITDTKIEDVVITQNGENVKVVKITPPKEAEIKPVSVVLTIDVSGSMTGSNIELAKEAAKTFVDLTPLEISEVAITTFDGYNYLNQDFTKDADKLHKAIDQIYAQGSTNYNFGFSMPASGGLTLASKGLYDKNVIFLTDGQGDGNTSEIIKAATKNDVTVYSVTLNMPMPEVLKDVSEQTNGAYYENISDVEDAKMAYISILKTIQNTTFGEISWVAKPACTPQNNFVFDFDDLRTSINYNIPPSSIIKLRSNNDYLSFGEIPVGDTLSKSINISAQNDDFEIISITNTNPEVFQISYPEETPFTLPKSKFLKLNIDYIPEEEGLIFTKITVETNKCSNKTIYAYGGNPTIFSSKYTCNLEVVNPNGGELLVAGSQDAINWQGVQDSELVQVEISYDNGQSFYSLGEKANGQLNFDVPLIKSDSCIVRISQKNYLSEIAKIKSRAGTVNSAHFNKNGNKIIISNQQGKIIILDVNNDKAIHNFRGHKGFTLATNFNPDETKVVSGGKDQKVIVWDLTTETELWTSETKRFLWKFPYKRGHGATITCANFSKDGNFVATADNFGEVFIWNAANGKKITKFNHNEEKIKKKKYKKYKLTSAAVNCMEFSPDSTILLTGGSDKNVKLWNYQTGELLNTINLGKKVYSAEFNADGSQFATGDSDGNIIFWATNSGTKIKEINDAHRLAITALDFSPDQNKIASAGYDNKINIWNVNTLESDGTIVGTKRNSCTNVEFNPSGSSILVSNEKGAVKIYSASESSLQIDMSDNVFAIVSPIPIVDKIVMKSTFVETATTEIINGCIKNKNMADVYIKKIEFIGADSSEFYLVSGFPPFKVSANKNKNVEFGFKANKIGIATAKVLIITSTDTIIADISCEAKEKPFELNDLFINFGKVKPYKESVKNIAIFKNVSSKTIVIEDFKNTGPDLVQFKINSRVKGMRVAPGKELKINVSYRPEKRGQTSTALRFYLKGFSQSVTVSMLGECDVPRFVKIEGTTIDELTGQPISVDLNCFDKVSGRSILTAKSDRNGKYSFIIPVEREYSINANRKNYLPANNSVILKGLDLPEVITKDFELLPLIAGNKVILNLNFETNKASLTSEGKKQLNGILKYLESYPEKNIEINGHTDNVGTEEKNQKLSEDRATSVKKYLVAKGIKNERITTNGFGFSMPLNSNETEEDKYQNRRVEILLK